MLSTQQLLTGILELDDLWYLRGSLCEARRANLSHFSFSIECFLLSGVSGDI